MKNEPAPEDIIEPTTDEDTATPVVDKPEMDKAVDDISKHDSDELLKAEDAKHEISEAPKRPWYKRLFRNKKIAIPAAIVLLLAILMAVPLTRYSILGLFLKDNYALTVWDGQTNQPISAATVSMAGKTAMTDNHGNAHLKVAVGHHTLTVSKKYYTSLSTKVLVPLRSHAGSTPFSVKATGRQVPVTITNKITGKPINDATVKAAGTEAHTDKNGRVTVVLPADKASVAATISASGYNDVSTKVQVTTQTVKANDFQLTPTGKIYFLSKLSGKIDVVKTNLDGTDRQTVLAGSGNEDDQNTVLLASRDWKFLALYSKRDTTGHPQINLIDTSSDQLTNIDKGDAAFTLIGWSGHSFTYDVVRNSVPTTQSGHEVIKNYNADSNKINVVDQSAPDDLGNSPSFGNFYQVDDGLFYISSWSYNAAPGDTDNVITIQLNGQNKKVVKSFDAVQTSSYFPTYQEKPNDIYIEQQDFSTGLDKQYFYEYEDGSVKTAGSSVTADSFNQPYPTFLLSPSDNQTFWSEPRDGKNTLFVGDADGQNGKQIASLSDYDTFGWYSDNYILVSKDSDELYIMPVAGGTPLKISDYHKPALTFRGYGGGYGG